MQQQTLEWKRKDFFNYSIYDYEEVADERLYNWHRVSCRDIELMCSTMDADFSIEFHGKIISIHYIEHDGKIYLPGKGADFSCLSVTTDIRLKLASCIGLVYIVPDKYNNFFERVIHSEAPKQEPLFNNQYDFKKFIGTRIWKNTTLVEQ